MKLHITVKAAVIVGLTAAACTGTIEGPSAPASDGEPVKGPDAPPVASADFQKGMPSELPKGAPSETPVPGVPDLQREAVDFSCAGKTAPPPRQRLWRLTPAQYLATMGTLFRGRRSPKNNSVSPPGGVLSPLEPVGPFYRFKTYSGTHGITDFEFRRSMSLSADTSRRLVDSLAKGTCLGGTQPFEICAAKIIREKGSILFRRPLTDAEVATYTNAARSAADSLGPQEGLGMAFQSMLLAPQFIFRTEIGDPVASTPGVFKLTPYEIAAAISYTLTNAPADTDLWDAAERDDLGPDQVMAHATRILGSDYAPAKSDFVVQHFELERALLVPKAEEEYCKFGRGRILQDARALIADVLSTNARKGFLETLLTTNTVYSGCDSSWVYGLKPSGSDNTKGSFPDRAGLLTQPAFLVGFSATDENMPVRRGKFINESLLCRSVPDLPIGTIPQLPPRSKTTSLRERLSTHRADPACAACHNLLDAAGLAFETFDHLGRTQVMEAGKPVDARGTLAGVGDADGSFDGVADLSRHLSRSRTVERCFVRHGFRFFMGRDEGSFDGCALDAAQKAFAAGGGDYVALVSTLFGSKSFLYRSREGANP